eukprot:Hpha_TRINITY_DN15946_c3_g1::TRINITY_DN15946_c3_g1_i1::g.73148::m.73148
MKKITGEQAIRELEALRASAKASGDVSRVESVFKEANDMIEKLDAAVTNGERLLAHDLQVRLAEVVDREREAQGLGSVESKLAEAAAKEAESQLGGAIPTAEAATPAPAAYAPAAAATATAAPAAGGFVPAAAPGADAATAAGAWGAAQGGWAGQTLDPAAAAAAAAAGWVWDAAAGGWTAAGMQQATMVQPQVVMQAPIATGATYAAAGYGQMAGYSQMPMMATTGSGQEMRPGDWMCPQCANHNFANRLQCNRCKAARPEGGAVAGAVGMG